MSPLDKNSKIFVAGHRGMVGSALVRRLQAGGYTNLNTQISQIENCVAGGAQAVIIGAVSYDGLSNLLAELKKKNVPVVESADSSTR